MPYGLVAELRQKKRRMELCFFNRCFFAVWFVRFVPVLNLE